MTLCLKGENCSSLKKAKFKKEQKNLVLKKDT